jgi:DNA-binding CsgD family transcriptional regulator
VEASFAGVFAHAPTIWIGWDRNSERDQETADTYVDSVEHDATNITQLPQLLEQADGGPGSGWFLIAPDALPPGWRSRAIPVYLLSLDLDDVKRLIPAKSEIGSQLDDEERAVAELAAQGAAAGEISQQLHLSRRSVFRRLARLRDLAGVRTNAELATRLAKENL